MQEDERMELNLVARGRWQRNLVAAAAEATTTKCEVGVDKISGKMFRGGEMDGEEAEDAVNSEESREGRLGH